MKKFFMMAAMAVCTMAANAQVWTGGELGYWRDYDENQTTFSIKPEVGYNLNEDWAVAMKIGYNYGYFHKNNRVKRNTFVVEPYLRYNALKFGNVTLFTDMGFAFSTGKVKIGENESDAANSYEIGVKPGISFAVNDKWGFVSHIGFFGFRDSNDAYKTLSTTFNYPKNNEFGDNGFGFSIENGLTFGVYYNF